MFLYNAFAGLKHCENDFLTYTEMNTNITPYKMPTLRVFWLMGKKHGVEKSSNDNNHEKSSNYNNHEDIHYSSSKCLHKDYFLVSISVISWMSKLE